MKDITGFYAGLDACFKEKNTDKTLAYIEECLRVSEDNKDDALKVCALNEYSGFLRALGRLDEAESVSLQSLGLMEKYDMKDTADYATALINLGDVYIFAKEYEKAIEILEKAETMLVSLELDKDYRMAALENNLSMAYREVTDYNSAGKALETALEIIETLPDCCGELATTYVNLGELKIKMNELDEAECMLLKACELFGASGEKDVHLSSAHSGLGNIYFLKGQYAKAESCFEKAAELIERDFGKTAYYYLMKKNIEMINEREV